MTDNADYSHSKSLRTHRREHGCFFVTKTIQPRMEILDYEYSQLISSTWRFYVQHGKIMLGAFVVMQDHFHILFSPVDGKNVSTRMREAMQWINKNGGDLLRRHGCAWQDGFHETRIKSSVQFQHVRSYIHFNPVKAGLCEKPEMWRWSSANPDYSSIPTVPWPYRFELDD